MHAAPNIKIGFLSKEKDYKNADTDDSIASIGRPSPSFSYEINNYIVDDSIMYPKGTLYSVLSFFT